MIIEVDAFIWNDDYGSGYSSAGHTLKQCVPPDRNTMYGFIHCALANMVLTEYSENNWAEIISRSKLQLDGGSFQPHRRYSEADTMKLFRTTADCIGVSFNKFLESFGDHFFRYCLQSGYRSTLRALGNNLLDFLSNLDALHDHFESVYPDMRSPTFRCTPADDGGLWLHYVSERVDFYPMTVGVVKAVARDFFNVSVVVEPLLPLTDGLRNGTKKREREIVLSIKETNNLLVTSRRRSSSLVSELSRFKASTNPTDLPMGVATFCRAFPFHVMFDRQMKIVQCGAALLRSIRRTTRAIGRQCPLTFNSLFSVVRPVLDLSFSAILNHLNSVFIVTTRPDALRLDASNSASCASHSMRLKGQMIYVRECDSMLFLCSPRVTTADELKSRRLFLSDIPLHDATRDLILITQARQAERELVEKLEETSADLRRLEARLQEDKQRTDQLLHSILPSNVAARLRLNLPAEAEKYELVTVLFSDIVQFTSMCGDERVVAMDIVRVLNRLYTQFDMLVELNQLYKVETIGDAYMVVGGLPEFTRGHADHAVSMALGMIEVSERVLSPVDQRPLQLRIGIHSGPCVAGVVGQKMPRYCLFGETVALASSMETLSRPGRINISKAAKSYLTTSSQYTFTRNIRSETHECYYVSMSPGSPLPVRVDLSVPVPKGMFRTPNPSPPSTRPSSPTEQPAQLTVPGPCTLATTIQMPIITVDDADAFFNFDSQTNENSIDNAVPQISQDNDCDSIDIVVPIQRPSLHANNSAKFDVTDNIQRVPMCTSPPPPNNSTWSVDLKMEKETLEVTDIEEEERPKMSKTCAVDETPHNCNGVTQGTVLDPAHDVVLQRDFNVASTCGAASERSMCEAMVRLCEPVVCDTNDETASAMRHRRPSSFNNFEQTLCAPRVAWSEKHNKPPDSAVEEPHSVDIQWDITHNGCHERIYPLTINSCPPAIETQEKSLEAATHNGNDLSLSCQEVHQVARKHSLVVYFRAPKDADVSFEQTVKSSSFNNH